MIHGLKQKTGDCLSLCFKRRTWRFGTANVGHESLHGSFAAWFSGIRQRVTPKNTYNYRRRTMVKLQNPHHPHPHHNHHKHKKTMIVMITNIIITIIRKTMIGTIAIIIYIGKTIRVNYGDGGRERERENYIDLTATLQEWWFVRGIIPMWGLISGSWNLVIPRVMTILRYSFDIMMMFIINHDDVHNKHYHNL